MKYTDAHRAFMVATVPGRTHKETAELFSAEFGIPLTPRQVQSYVKNHNVKARIEGTAVILTGNSGCFQKGHNPFNKGKKQSDYMSAEAIERTKASRFPKGELPQNHRQIGDERLSKDGYIEVKVSMFRHKRANDCWVQKHRLVWEEANGPIPEDHVLIFLDSDRSNISIDNLELVPMDVNLARNRLKISGHDTDSGKTTVLMAKMMAKATELKRKAD